jgi:hypothetical protein
MTGALLSLHRIDRMICPMLTRATVPYGLPQAPRIPVCNLIIIVQFNLKHSKHVLHLSAPAQLNILLILITWNGCTRTLKWKESFPLVFVTYLFAQILAASNASLDSCSYSSDTKWQQNGNSSTFARLRPKSNILIYQTSHQMGHKNKVNTYQLWDQVLLG